jgi:hypothetical protein
MIEGVISAGSEDGYIIMSGCKISDYKEPSKVDGYDEYSVTIIPQSTSSNIDDLMQKYNPW